MEDRKRETTLGLRQEKTALLHSDAHNPLRHLERGWIHEELDLPDLAAADAYRALSLFETVIDPDSSEYHAKARNISVLTDELDQEDSSEQWCDNDEDGGNFTLTSRADYDENIGHVYRLLVRSLVKCGCLKDAYEFCIQGMALPDDHLKDDEGLKEQLHTIKQSVTGKQAAQLVDPDAPDFEPSLLNSQGFARRILYPWNTHEPERKSPETLELLNKMLSEVSSKCEVRAVTLPALHSPLVDEQDKKMGKCSQKEEESEPEVSIQLGLFAKEDIAPGEIILRESSFLTATNRLHDDFCDACNGPLPDLSSESSAVACEDCDDIIFCSSSCADAAQDIYHGAVCGQDGLASIGKSTPDPKEKADYLYLLLLGRAIAMAATQQIHPLDLPEVKYIWGDFYPWEDLEDDDHHNNPSPATFPPGSTLPFSFQLNILQPMRMLEEMEIDPFSSLPLYDTWILNTLYAKFRGTASGRLSTWDGGPEVCAVHPLWCLANHSCDPNVRWEWGGEITFVAREKERKVRWKTSDGELGPSCEGGIKKDEEILNHYCDVGLGVKDRREWAMGALGGACLCERCLFEAGEES